MADEAAERNKASFRRLQENVIVGGNVELVPTLFRPDFQTHRTGLKALFHAFGVDEYPQEGDAHERFLKGLAGMQTILPNQERLIDEICGDGDQVVARWRIRATDAVSLGGREPTGKRLEWTEIGFVRFDDDGRMAEGWFLSDEIDLAEQLGVSLTPAR